MKRNKTKLVSKRGQKYKLIGQSWTTYENFVDMYQHTYNELVEAGVAIDLKDGVWMHRSGKICSELDAHGCKVFQELIRPDMCIVGYEVGGNLCMKRDGHVGEEKMLTATGKFPQRKALSRYCKFTLVGITALNGEAVMCIIFLCGAKPNGSIEARIDIKVQPIGSPSDRDFISKNSGSGK